MKHLAALLVTLALVLAISGATSARKEKTRPMPPSNSQDIMKKLADTPSTEGVLFWNDVEKMAHVKGQRAKLSPTRITWDEKLLNERDRQVLRRLVEAAHFINEIFLQQVYSRNVAMRKRLQATRTPLAKELLGYFTICFGPFDVLDGRKNFIDDAVHPEGANFYPEDMKKEELEQWLKDHPGDREAFTSSFTVIRRKGDRLVAVPYPVEYRTHLEPAAKALKKAAELSDNESFRRFLSLRADALLSNNYYDSDVAWLDVKDSLFEVVVGPYEVYEDNLFNYKASYEAFITINDPGEGKKLELYASLLKDMEANLPIAEEHKNFRRKFESPIRVVQEIYNAGDARAGIQTSAFNLPNDERVREAKGCKKVMLKNVMEAKFKKSLTPISRKVIDESQLGLVKFDAYFRDVLFHELAHGLGPGSIEKNGARIDVAQALKDLYSPLEELKADILGIYNQTFLIEKGVIPKEDKPFIYTTYLAGLFRSVRFGLDEAHGMGTVVQFNYLLEKGAFHYDGKTGKYGVNADSFEPAMKSLVEKVLMIHALGDYEGAQALLKEYGHAPRHLRETLSKLREIPVDIEPIFTMK